MATTVRGTTGSQPRLSIERHLLQNGGTVFES